MKKTENLFSGQELLDCARKAVNGYAPEHFPDLFTREDLEDMASEVALNACSAKTPYDPTRGPLFSWVWIIARNVVLTNVAKKLRGRTLSIDAPEVIAACDSLYAELPADAQLLADELLETLCGQLHTEREQRILFLLRDEVKDKEIAEHLGVSDQTVYSAVFHLRDKLRSAI